jgi:hypothetical protein
VPPEAALSWSQEIAITLAPDANVRELVDVDIPLHQHSPRAASREPRAAHRALRPSHCALRTPHSALIIAPSIRRR